MRQVPNPPPCSEAPIGSCLNLLRSISQLWLVSTRCLPLTTATGTPKSRNSFSTTARAVSTLLQHKLKLCLKWQNSDSSGLICMSHYNGKCVFTDIFWNVHWQILEMQTSQIFVADVNMKRAEQIVCGLSGSRQGMPCLSVRSVLLKVMKGGGGWAMVSTWMSLGLGSHWTALWHLGLGLFKPGVSHKTVLHYWLVWCINWKRLQDAPQIIELVSGQPTRT